MQKMKDEEGDEALLRPTFSVKELGEAADAAKKKPKKVEVVMTKEGVKRTITMDEVKAHNTEAEPWFIVNGEVYDGTACVAFFFLAALETIADVWARRFLEKHPGGPESITLNAGEDASEDFMAIHSIDAKKQLADFVSPILRSALGLVGLMSDAAHWNAGGCGRQGRG